MRRSAKRSKGAAKSGSAISGSGSGASAISAGSGLSRAAQHRYRLELGARMLPTFLAGQGFYRIMRSDRARSALT